MGRLDGRNILLTGASSGVGRHLSGMLAGEGARVVCCARRTSELESLVAGIAAAGGRAIAQTCDVADANSIRSAFDAAEAAFGTMDGVIVNAGINSPGPAARLSVEDLDRILSINLRGAFLTAREGAVRMMAAGDPDPAHPRRIIFIASTTAKKPERGAAVYGATKAGVTMLARTLALEWARHEINVNSILPGFMPTDIVADYLGSEAGQKQVAAWPRRRTMPVADLDPAILFLLSPEARAVSGTDITVDDTQSLA